LERRPATHWNWSRLPLSRSIREIPEDLPDRVAEAVRVMVMSPVFRGSPWSALVPAVTRERSSERPTRGRSSEPRIVESAVDRERAPLEREVNPRASGDDVPPLRVSLDTREDTQPARMSEPDEVEVRDARLS
jgi:hypothetical protein